MSNDDPIYQIWTKYNKYHRNINHFLLSNITWCGGHLGWPNDTICTILKETPTGYIPKQLSWKSVWRFWRRRFWKIFAIFSNGGHLGWPNDTIWTILKETPTGYIPNQLSLKSVWRFWRRRFWKVFAIFSNGGHFVGRGHKKIYIFACRNIHVWSFNGKPIKSMIS